MYCDNARTVNPSAADAIMRTVLVNRIPELPHGSKTMLLRTIEQRLRPTCVWVLTVGLYSHSGPQQPGNNVEINDIDDIFIENLAADVVLCTGGGTEVATRRLKHHPLANNTPKVVLDVIG